MSEIRRPPSVNLRAGGLPAHFPKKEWANENIVLKKKDVLQYLKQKPQLMTDFMLESVDVDVLEEILIEKKKGGPFSHRKLGIHHPYSQQCMKDVSQDITDGLVESRLRETIETACRMMAQCLDADDYHIYIPDQISPKVHSLKNGRLGVATLDGTVSGYAMRKKKTILIEKLEDCKRYPNRLGNEINTDIPTSVLCVPVRSRERDLHFVLELIRQGEKRMPFNQADLHTVHAYTGWIAACFDENLHKNILHGEQYLVDFLSRTTGELFEGMTNTDELVQRIMTFTKNLVRADRCSMFLVDEERDELYADFFDEGSKSTIGTPIFKKKEQIRFPKDRGIAGHVAMTGEIVNILDAYKDSRFNPDVDKLTGFVTRNILAMPIISRGKVKGVVQMINSTKSEYFTKSDQNALRIFTGYCAFALHYSNVYNSLDKQQTRSKVALDMLEYHGRSSSTEADALTENPYMNDDDLPAKLYSYDFSPSKYNSVLPKVCIRIITDLCGTSRFDVDKLCRFVLTVRKNYRDIPYHNWHHGFNVFHSLWRMIDGQPDRFTPFEKMGMVISGLSHDIDHRGYTNTFFVKLDLPLANLYSTSVMEQHHYRQTVNILQSSGHNIFQFMEPAEYKKMLEFIRHCILATDLALYFDTQKYLQSKLDKNEFDFNDENDKLKLIALMMTAADLSGSGKSWKDQSVSTQKLYEEFYEQGDEEKRQGVTPIPMMDRDNVGEVPQQQLGFIDFICKPLFTTVCRLLPSSKPLLDGCVKNREKWEKKVEEWENFGEESEAEDYTISVHNISVTNEDSEEQPKD